MPDFDRRRLCRHLLALAAGPLLPGPARARSGATEAPLLLADEPTGNLDSRTSSGIHELFQSLTREHGTAMLIVTHNAELARNLPRCLRMKDGGLVNEFAEEANQ